MIKIRTARFPSLFSELSVSESKKLALSHTSRREKMHKYII